jgi:hypothetical protein
MFIKLTNGTPETYTIGQLRRDNPQTSFPKDIPAEILADYSVYKVRQVSAPQIDNKTHKHTQSVAQVDGVWTQVWTAVELPLEQAETNVRAHRGHLLQETDWVVAKAYEAGDPVSSAWVSYRQALRDITDQAGFPYEVTWPTKP